jgi:hypothetical protein
MHGPEMISNSFSAAICCSDPTALIELNGFCLLTDPTFDLVCVENLVRIDLMGESLNVGPDGRAALFLSDAVGLAVQVEEPT